MANAAPTTTDANRERLRSERKLRPLKEDEQGNAIDLVEGGVFGFTYSPSTEGVPMFSKHTYQAFEVHKLFNGEWNFLGYMSTADAQSLDSAKDTTELKLYPEPYGDANTFVTVPNKRILKGKPATRELGNYMSFLCVPKE